MLGTIGGELGLGELDEGVLFIREGTSGRDRGEPLPFFRVFVAFQVGAGHIGGVFDSEHASDA